MSEQAENAFLAMLLVSLIVLLGCAVVAYNAPPAFNPSGLPHNMRVEHDDVRNVTCWRIVGGGLACLPDAAIDDPAEAAQ